jgi:hypothetical protein
MAGVLECLPACQCREGQGWSIGKEMDIRIGPLRDSFNIPLLLCEVDSLRSTSVVAFGYDTALLKLRSAEQRGWKIRYVARALHQLTIEY